MKDSVLKRTLSENAEYENTIFVYDKYGDVVYSSCIKKYLEYDGL